MSATPIILQRLRFGGIEFRFDPPRGKFDRVLWEKRARLTYWQTTDDVRWGAALELPPAGAVSGDTFFNAFYLAHWRKLTTLQSLSLEINYEGECRLEVFCHTEQGKSELLLGIDLSAEKDEFIFPFPSENIANGLRFSFKFAARGGGARLLGGAWSTDAAPTRPVRLTVGIAVHNREDLAMRIVRQIVDDPLLRAERVRILLIDQTNGSNLENISGDSCRVIRQPNLGASGGVARAMEACLSDDGNSQPTHLLMLEDDLELETDSILRTLRLAQLARQPFLLSGGRLDAYVPFGLHNLGATWRKDASGDYENWMDCRNNLRDIDVSLPAYLDAISIPYASDFGGWWFWMVPVEVFAEVGTPMNLFSKGAEVEYGIRGREHGYFSHTVPGLGVWQVPPYAKVDIPGFYLEEYFKFMMNATGGDAEVTALFRTDAARALQDISEHRYQRALARIRAMEDFLGGSMFYKSRKFPADIIELKKDLDAYEANELTLPKIREEQSAALRERLQALVARFPREAKAARESLAILRRQVVPFGFPRKLGAP